MCDRRNLTGEERTAGLKLRFDGRIRSQFHGTKVTSDAGLLAARELDEAMGLTALAGSALMETRRGRNVQHDQIGLLRQAVYSRLAGCEHTNDAGRIPGSRLVPLGAIRKRAGRDPARRLGRAVL